ncbi:Acetyl-CoA acetyltransferase [Candidatus Paraburkholderia kirkii]|nr:Acetyl-CoA acetyltransferase [Candidatus Paraburkholderia kirkii]
MEVKEKGGTRFVDQDEHPRAGVTMENLAGLRPVRQKIDAESTVTAGNASGQNDGAAVCVVTTLEKAAALGLRPLARLLAWAGAGVEPERMGIGPVPATELALRRAGLALKDLDLIELNEAFAAQVLACTAGMGFEPADYERLNVNGSGISLSARPSGRCDRRANFRDDAARARPPRRTLRSRDDVHRRRAGARGGVRARRRVTLMEIRSCTQAAIPLRH